MLLNTFFILVFPDLTRSMAFWSLGPVPKSSLQLMAEDVLSRGKLGTTECKLHMHGLQSMELGGKFPKLSSGEAESTAFIQPEAEKAKGSVTGAVHCPVSGWWEVKGRLFLEACWERTMEACWEITNKVQRGKFWLRGRKKLSTMRLLWHWDRQPRGLDKLRP